MNPLSSVAALAGGSRIDASKLGAAWSRRGFLLGGLGAALGRYAVAPAFALSGPRADARSRITFINLRGGNDALNTFVPTGLPRYMDLRRSIAITPENGASLNGGEFATTAYVLHPALAGIASLYREGQVACFPCVGYPGANQSHFTSQDVLSRGQLQRLEPDSGWIARYKDLYAPDVRSVVALGLSSQLDFLGGETPSTHTLPANRDAGAGRSVNYRFTGDRDYAANEMLRSAVVDTISARGRQHTATERARRTLLQAIEQAKQQAGGGGGNGGGGGGGPPPIEYPLTDLGLGLQTAAALLQADFPANIFYVNYGNFDTHGGQGGAEGKHADELRGLDEAVSAYARDLQRSGHWQSMILVVFSEFGRRNSMNNPAFGGTDHGEGGLMLLVGGAVRGGTYGTEITDQDLRGPVLPMHVDFRSVYWRLLAKHFGVDPGPVFQAPFELQEFDFVR